MVSGGNERGLTRWRQLDDDTLWPSPLRMVAAVYAQRRRLPATSPAWPAVVTISPWIRQRAIRANSYTMAPQAFAALPTCHRCRRVISPCCDAPWENRRRLIRLYNDLYPAWTNQAGIRKGHWRLAEPFTGNSRDASTVTKVFISRKRSCAASCDLIEKRRS